MFLLNGGFPPCLPLHGMPLNPFECQLYLEYFLLASAPCMDIKLYFLVPSHQAVAQIFLDSVENLRKKDNFGSLLLHRVPAFTLFLTLRIPSLCTRWYSLYFLQHSGCFNWAVIQSCISGILPETEIKLIVYMDENLKISWISTYKNLGVHMYHKCHKAIKRNVVAAHILT